MHSDSAVVSMTLRPRSIASRWVSSGMNAAFLPALTYLEAIERGLKVMDTTALSLCMDNDIPIHVFEQVPGNIRRVVSGERVGTIISKEGGT